jgi:hypothetical protein
MTTDTSTRVGSATGSPGGERVQEAASDLIDQAGRSAQAQASATMTQAGQTLQRVAQVVREAGDELRADRPEIASVATTAANQVERAGGYLRDHDAADAWNAATDAARRQPALVIGGALIAGFALGRFLRTATETQASRYGGTSASRSRFGTAAGAPSSYGGRFGGDDADSTSSGTTDFENRTGELEGTIEDRSTGGSSVRPSAMSSATTSSSRSTSTSSSTRSSGSNRRGRPSTSTTSSTSRGS